MAIVKIIGSEFVSSSAANFAMSVVRKVIYEGDNLLDIITSTLYPVEGIRMPENTAFILTGREITQIGNVLSDGGRGCVAEASFTYTLSTEVRRMYKEDPWDIGAQNVSIAFSTASMPFTHGWDVNGKRKAVVNSAGTKIACEATEYIKELHFVYCQKAKGGRMPTVAEVASRNSSTVTVAGVNIPARCGKILPQNSRYIAEYDAWGEVYREYWEIDTTIMIRNSPVGWSLELLDMGTITKSGTIWQWMNPGGGSVHYGTHGMASLARRNYANDYGEVGSEEYVEAYNSFSMQEVTEPLPLRNGILDTAAMLTGDYHTIEIYDCEALSWNSFSLPRNRA